LSTDTNAGQSSVVEKLEPIVVHDLNIAYALDAGILTFAIGNVTACTHERITEGSAAEKVDTLEREIGVLTRLVHDGHVVVDDCFVRRVEKRAIAKQSQRDGHQRSRSIEIPCPERVWALWACYSI